MTTTGLLNPVAEVARVAAAEGRRVLLARRTAIAGADLAPRP